MKIVLVTIFYPPARIGGTEIYTHALAKALRKAGHHVQVVCAENWGQGESYWNGYSDTDYESVPVRRLAFNWEKAPDVNRYLYDNPFLANQLETYFAEWQPDLVHITSCQTLSASAIAAAKRAGLAVVVTLTDFWFICPRVTLVRGDGRLCDGQVEAYECLKCLLLGTKLYSGSKTVLGPELSQKFLTGLSHRWWLSRWRGLRGMAFNMENRRTTVRDALKQADCCIAPSHAVKRAFEQNAFTTPIQVIPHGNDLEWLATYHGKTPSPKVRIGYIGQILPIKGVDVILRAFNTLPKDAPVELYIHGPLDKNSWYSKELYELAAGQTRIHFEGPFKRAELGRILSNLDVLVIGSTWNEPYGLVIQEAFATQTPVIASNVGAIPESVQDEMNGLLYQAGDDLDLARQLRRVIEDNNLLRRLRAGISPVKTMESEVSDLTRIYEALASRTTAAGSGDAELFGQSTRLPNPA